MIIGSQGLQGMLVAVHNIDIFLPKHITSLYSPVSLPQVVVALGLSSGSFLVEILDYCQV